jgi:hypothetical protein
MRTVFDRASELLGIDPEKTFKQKLNDLKVMGHITEKEVKVLTALIDAGSAAAHRGWQPKPKQLDNMITILEAFLHRAFLLEEIGAELDQGVPKRSCSIPDDHVSPRRSALFMARSVLRDIWTEARTC